MSQHHDFTRITIGDLRDNRRGATWHAKRMIKEGASLRARVGRFTKEKRDDHLPEPKKDIRSKTHITKLET